MGVRAAAAGKTWGAVALCGALVACSGTPGTPVGSGEPSGQPIGPRWVSGYYAGWFWDWYPPAAVDMTAMTHFIFGRYAPGGGTLGGRPGQVVEGAGTGHEASVEQALVDKAHAAGVKALIMLGGAGDGPGFDASTADPAVRSEFVSDILGTLAAKNYDGVDVDWEENLETPAQQRQVVALLGELRAGAADHPHFRPPHAPIIITWPAFWTTINFRTITPWHVTVASLVDQYNLMTYSMADAWPGWVSWHHAALQDAQPSHPTSIEASVAEYVAAGVPPGKIGIGIGFYGIYYGAEVDGPRQGLRGGHAQGSDLENNFRRLSSEGAFTQPGATRHWDERAKQSYYSYSPPWRRYGNTPIGYLTFEDERSIAAKGQWADAQGIGGAMIWTVNYGCTDPATGANPLLQAVKDAFLAARPASR
jgi:GH18 family chitinase